jgi:probable RNA-binding protein EIF1AD
MPKPKRNINAVAEETLNPPSELGPNEQIARVKQGAGKNLYHLELPDGQPLLAELPSKFRSTIWMKRGSYVLVDNTALADRENKLGGEIVNLVGDEKAWRKMAWWPKEFPAKKTGYGSDDSEDDGPQMPPSSSDEDEE